MRQWLIAAAALALGCAPDSDPSKTQAPPEAPLPLADAAGNRMEALIIGADGRGCTADGAYCVSSDGTVTFGDGRHGRAPPGGDDRGVWPVIVRLGDGAVLVGFTEERAQMYSGGGGTATHATIYVVGGAGGNAPVLTAPLSGAVSIRACFDEDDLTARREACVDEYSFAGALALDTSVASGPPRLILTTEAWTYPGRRSRNRDATADSPLTAGDLVRWRDETCSYTRVASWRDGAYVWDSPLPSCTDYLEP